MSSIWLGSDYTCNLFVLIRVDWPEGVPATFPITPPTLIQVNLSEADVPDWKDILPHEFAQVYLGEQPLPYVASMFHTLHCTHMLLESLNGTMSMPSMGTLRAMHLTHCVNYIRQMILCQADATLEEMTHPGDRHGTPGNRKCRDWKTVLRVTEEEYQLWLRNSVDIISRGM